MVFRCVQAKNGALSVCMEDGERRVARPQLKVSASWVGVGVGVGV